MEGHLEIHLVDLQDIPLKDSELPSVIDYSLVDTEIITLVKFFQISQLFFFSDHCCIKAHIRANFSVQKPKKIHIQPAPAKFV